MRVSIVVSELSAAPLKVRAAVAAPDDGVVEAVCVGPGDAVETPRH